MKRLVRHRPSPAMVIACLALGIALTGTSVAAVTALAPNSVGTPQIKANAVTAAKLRNANVTGAKIARNAVTGTKVLNGSLTAADFVASSLPKGPTGPTGATGPAVNLSHNPAEDTDPVFTSDGSQVIFMSDRVGLRTRLFKMYPDGTLQTELPGTADLDKDPAMAPDGSAVVFAAQRGSSTDEIWTLNLTTGTTRRLTLDSFADRSPDWQGLILVTNHPPLAAAGDDMNVPCADADGAMVSLDGSGSSDPDNNLAIYEWFAAFGTSNQHLLGTGLHLDAALPLGTTEVTLRVTDADGLQDTDSMTVTVVDPVAPTLSVATDVTELWPPNHQMVDVHATVEASGGLCSPTPAFVLQGVQVADETAPKNGRGLGGQNDSDVAGAELGTADLELQLRAERPGTGSRTYTITYVLTSGSGTGIMAWAKVVVPHDQRIESHVTAKPVTLKSDTVRRRPR